MLTGEYGENNRLYIYSLYTTENSENFSQSSIFYITEVKAGTATALRTQLLTFDQFVVVTL